MHSAEAQMVRLIRGDNPQQQALWDLRPVAQKVQSRFRSFVRKLK